MLQGVMVLSLGAALILTGPTAQLAPTEPQATPATVPVSAPAPTAAPNAEHRLISALGLAGGYVTLGTWMWFAWYKDKPTLPQWRLGGDGWFSDRTYAGGADKLGHVWTNLALSRLGTELLREGGWSPWSSSLLASGICLGAFLLVEVNDGFYTEFSPGDMTSNALGAVLAVAMSNWPALDDAIDFRVEWFPSRAFRHSPSADFAEDYSGQTYLLAFKPRSIAALRAAPAPLNWLQFINPVLGLASRNYLPAPASGSVAQREQRVLIGVTLDLQALIDAASGQPAPAVGFGWKIGHALFEVFNPPFATLPLRSVVHSSHQVSR
jgi:hypothetical protein